MENYLLPDEHLIARSQGDQVFLTNLRIRFSENGTDVKSIMVDQISGVSMFKDHKPWLLFLTVCSLIASGAFLTETEPSYAIFPVVGAVIFVLLYFGTRRHVVTVASSALAIVFQTKGMDTAQVLKFINQIEEARKSFLEVNYQKT